VTRATIARLDHGDMGVAVGSAALQLSAATELGQRAVVVLLGTILHRSDENAA
jgi:hypothetical protein